MDACAQTSTDPAGIPATLTRMASIPHGTTINAQCVSPISSVAGPPDFTLPQNQVNPTPFPPGGKPLTGAFLNLAQANNPNTLRIPQDLSKFIAQGVSRRPIFSRQHKCLWSEPLTENFVCMIDDHARYPQRSADGASKCHQGSKHHSNH